MNKPIDEVMTVQSVLVVDDGVGARESLRMILKKDYEVFLAKNAEEAFAQIKGHSPDVILLDIILPNIDGLKVLEIVKKNEPDALVIMITATKTVKTAVEARIIETAGLFDVRARQAAVQGLLGQVLEDRVWIPLYHDRGALLVRTDVRYEPRADGYLRVADVRPDPAASR